MQLGLRSFALFPLLAALSVRAVDLRELVTFSGGDGVTFCKQWNYACINYETGNSSLSFQQSFCNPGDFSGNNLNSEAKVFCAFTDGVSIVPVDETHPVAAEVGATFP